MVELLPGDILLYPPTSLLGWLIAIKTWEKVSHVEVYIGNGMSVASRNKIGVNQFALRKDFCRVLRPTGTFNVAKALTKFHALYQGEAYDWFGLLRFVMVNNPKRGNKHKQFCSEFARRFLRDGNIETFRHAFDSSEVAPATFLSSLALIEIKI